MNILDLSLTIQGNWSKKINETGIEDKVPDEYDFLENIYDIDFLDIIKVLFDGVEIINPYDKECFYNIKFHNDKCYFFNVSIFNNKCDVSFHSVEATDKKEFYNSLFNLSGTLDNVFEYNKMEWQKKLPADLLDPISLFNEFISDIKKNGWTYLCEVHNEYLDEFAYNFGIPSDLEYKPSIFYVFGEKLSEDKYKILFIKHPEEENSTSINCNNWYEIIEVKCLDEGLLNYYDVIVVTKVELIAFKEWYGKKSFSWAMEIQKFLDS